ncbi:dodecin domain-containing protein [Roseomonas terrae]|uniref:Dodecin domain-containing protein n=1 Tax=Neoroseomonas terrae TaxID=424799 RepID=A0ABS5ECR8_9PROT|nr:dodecin [Neoroseomonas terrae]MBR0648755.1 dodecin domain-containing protein [Neoroseomonas terrae]
MEEEPVYHRTDLVGSSRKSVSDAIETAIGRAVKSLRHIEWFEVSEIRGRVQDGKVSQYQVSIPVPSQHKSGVPRRGVMADPSCRA